MNGQMAWKLAVCLLGTLCVGCAQSPGTIRAQNPAESDQWQQGAIQQVGFRHGKRRCKGRKCGPINTYAGPGCNNGSCQGCGNGSCQGCGNGCCEGNQGCGGVGCLGCLDCCPRDWYPTHRHWYRYEPPGSRHCHENRDLVYPPANVPGAVVQYPYYTVKGPSDFFLKTSNY
jgi:hypothetical protein